MDQTAKTVDLMRGLPGCGKSHRARRLAGTGGVYAAFAIARGYQVELAEPDSLWWLELQLMHTALTKATRRLDVVVEMKPQLILERLPERSKQFTLESR